MIELNMHKVMLAKNMDIQTLAERSGLPMETVRNLYYGRVKEPRLLTVLKISNALGVSVNYLANANSNEAELLANYNNSSHHGKEFIETVARIESELTDMAKCREKHIVPLLEPIGKVDDGVEWNSCNVTELETDIQDAYMGIIVSTNNFVPAFTKGDKILLANRFPTSSEMAIFMMNGRAYFRKYIEKEDEYVLACLNGRGVDMHLKRLDMVQCIGTFVGVERA